MTFREAVALLLVADVEAPRDDRELQRLVCRMGDAIAEPTIERLRALWVVLGHARRARELRAEWARLAVGWRDSKTNRGRGQRVGELASWYRVHERAVAAAVRAGFVGRDVAPASAWQAHGTAPGRASLRRAANVAGDRARAGHRSEPSRWRK